MYKTLDVVPIVAESNFLNLFNLMCTAATGVHEIQREGRVQLDGRVKMDNGLC